MINVWDMAPNTVPTTCNLEIDDEHNFHQTYQRSAVAIYTKLQNTSMSKVPFFQQILEHERTSQDGYKVLYGMLCICHPKLVEKTKQDPPSLTTNGSLFSFIRQYTNYLECEKIANRKYTNIEGLTFVMNALENDGRFEKALGQLRIHKNMFEELSKTNPSTAFPPSLTVEILPYTIMKSYTTEEKHALFIESDTTPKVRAYSGKNIEYCKQPTVTNFQRQRLTKTCSCCGIYRHDVNTTGCDFAASFLLTTTYLRNNPNAKRNIITNFKNYQQSKLDKIKSTTKSSLSSRIKKSAQDKRIGITPTVQLLIEAIGDTIENDDDQPSDYDNDIFDISDILMEDGGNNNDDSNNFHDTNELVPSNNNE